ncbi:hypothetical protein SERLA73DRAFT_192189 [Serpula lacrymans var. lacrymans S7.3]|uniref:N-acetyltransferase domain-containing protein n=2 Tax=Serpula lacrymans var. lacrymans TaxID=341189 RepID=F8QJ85_SERL3|nr:uncharacterized protein SERLADRAFT_465269 [Serpula lacrymans var. lacrymans S7.9]EGN91639.1 hypothetical protein SERLA73DRAFT_192189 [Serpula lacrymans var. lacrymans S7.3]EGO25314.1 hypothetical protein SERLADRAFT_465269 [Serpula lacrymans var. lacrymans S7.9]
MSYINSYHAPELPALSDEELLGPEPYDVNFLYRPGDLSTDRIRLTPFIPRLHAEAFLAGIKGHDDVFKYIPLSLDTPQLLLGFTEFLVRRQPENILFAIIDTTRPDPARPELQGSLAGLIGLLYTSTMMLKTEMGPVVVLPAFQRTHVATHAVGTLLRYALETPTNGGMGMRRVAWTAHPDNVSSHKAATRMGFKVEGQLRWFMTMQPGSVEGLAVREGDPTPEKLGRDSVLYAICWDDWEKEARELVNRAITRI